MDDDATLLAADIDGHPASVEQGSSHVLVLSGGSVAERRIPIGRTHSLIGRTPPCDIVLPGSSVSRQHCRVQLADNQVSVTDLGSTNGTFVDGQRVSGTKTLHHGAALQVGTYVLTYHRRTAREMDDALALDRDVQGASAYVKMLLPKPIVSGSVCANWLYLPCAKLSGNAFGYRFISPSLFIGFMLDVAGSGMEAAMHSVAVLNLLRQSSIPGVDFGDPSSVLAKLNRTFQREHYNGLFFSIWYFAYDLQAGMLSYGSAGAHVALVQRDGGLKTLEASGSASPIGLEPDQGFAIRSERVNPGDKLILMSDCACEVIERRDMQAEPGWLLSGGEGEPSLSVPEPLRLYNVIRWAAGSDGLEGDFSTVVFDF